MKRTSILPLLLLLTMSATAQSDIIIKVSDPEIGFQLGGTQLIPAVDGHYFLVSGDLDVIRTTPGVVAAEPDRKFTVPAPEKPQEERVPQRSRTRSTSTGSPSDPYFDEQYYLQAIRMPELWQIPLKPNVKRPVIAILDSGVDIEHPDLKDNIWTNEAELNGLPGVDDDGNGYIDDIHGWNVPLSNNDVTDRDGHGTHCAGIAAAVADNSIGIAGANPDALIMPVSVYSASDRSSYADSYLVKGFNYAIANGADIVSMSIGLPSCTIEDGSIVSEIYGLLSQKVIPVIAAGNDMTSISSGPYYPAAVRSVIGVEASDRNGGLAYFSNYDDDTPWTSSLPNGENYELRAPGEKILSTLPGGDYGYRNGTSMATPLVAGAISRLISIKDYRSREEMLRDLILSRGKDLGDIDVMKAYNAQFTPYVSIHIAGSEIKSSVWPDSHIVPGRMVVTNMTDSTLTGLYAKMQLADPADTSALIILNGIQRIPEVRSDCTILIESDEILLSTSDVFIPGYAARLNLMLYNRDELLDSMSLTLTLSETLRYNDLKLKLTGDSAITISGFYDNCDTLTIPDSIKVNGTAYPVTVLEYLALESGHYECVLLPETLKRIGGFCFTNNTELKSVEIPASVRKLESYTFSDNPMLSSVTLHEGLESIGTGAFSYCVSLNQLTIPSTVNAMEYNLFEMCESLASVTCLSTVPPVVNMGSQEGRYDKFLSKGEQDCLERARQMISLADEDGLLNLFFEIYYVYGEYTVARFWKQFKDVPVAYDLLDRYFFEAIPICFSRLYVPEGCAEAYRAAEWWCLFDEIIEIGTTPVPAAKAPARQAEYRLGNHIIIREGKKYLRP